MRDWVKCYHYHVVLTGWSGGTSPNKSGYGRCTAQSELARILSSLWILHFVLGGESCVGSITLFISPYVIEYTRQSFIFIAMKKRECYILDQMALCRV